MAALYANHPYGIPIIGWEHEIAALDREDALSFYKRFYAPNNAILVIAGDVEPEEVRKLAEETYRQARAERRARTAAHRPQEPAAFRAGEGDARRPARRAHHRAALLSRAELRVGQAGRGRSARPLDAHRRHGLGQQDLQADGDRGQARRRMPAAGIPIQASIPAGSASMPSPPRTSPPRSSSKAIDAVIEELRAEGRHAGRARPRARLLYRRVRLHVRQPVAHGAPLRLAACHRHDASPMSRQWPDRLKRVTVEDIREAARKYLVDKNSVTGYLLPAPEHTSSIGEKPAHAPGQRQVVAVMARSSRLPLLLLRHGAGLAAAALSFGRASGRG